MENCWPNNLGFPMYPNKIVFRNVLILKYASPFKFYDCVKLIII